MYYKGEYVSVPFHWKQFYKLTFWASKNDGLEQLTKRVQSHRKVKDVTVKEFGTDSVTVIVMFRDELGGKSIQKFSDEFFIGAGDHWVTEEGVDVAEIMYYSVYSSEGGGDNE